MSLDKTTADLRGASNIYSRRSSIWGKIQTLIMRIVYGMVVYGGILLPALLGSASVTRGLFIDQQKKNLYSAEKAVDTNGRVKRACSLRPFNVTCHEYCPRRWTNDWENLIKYHNCIEKYERSTFHCAKDESGKFVEACAVPTDCYKGEEPILHFEKESKFIANVKCEPCSDGRFNPSEAMKSDEYSVCPYSRRNCGSYYGLVECDIVAGDKRTWTDSKCRCNITGNFLPQFDGPNNCTGDDDFRCYEYRPCPDTTDGRKQEYLSSNYTCVPKCGDGYHPRTLDTDECIPIVKSFETFLIGKGENNYELKSVDLLQTLDVMSWQQMQHMLSAKYLINDTGDTNTSTAVSVTTSTQAAVENVTEKVLTPPDGTTTTTERSTKGQDSNSTSTIIGICVAVIVILVGIICSLCIYKRARQKIRGCTSNRRGSAQNQYELEGLNSQGQSSHVEVPSSAPVSGDNTNHHEPGATSQNSQGQSSHVDVHSSPTLSENGTDHNEQGATRQDSQGQSSYVDVPSHPPVSGDNTDHNEQGATSQYSQGQSSRVDVPSSPQVSGDNTDHNEPGATTRDSQVSVDVPEQSLGVDVPSSSLVSGDNTDHNEPGATSQDSQVSVDVPEQSLGVDVPSSSLVSGDNTDHNEPGATSQDSQVSVDVPEQSLGVDVPSSSLVSGDNTDHNEPGATSQDSQGQLEWIEQLPVIIKERKLTEKDLTDIPSYIGNNWQQVAFKMGLDLAAVDHIKDDHGTAYLRIYKVIHDWRINNINSCTVENFLKILIDCSKTTIEWQKLKTFIENLSDDDSS